MSCEKKRRVWVLGATSAIAQSYAKLIASNEIEFLLVGRNENELKSNAFELKHSGAKVYIELTDFVKISKPETEILQWRKKYGVPNEVFIAYGAIGNHVRSLNEPEEVELIIQTNFTSVVLWSLAIVQCCLPKEVLTLVVISSVAGDRGRRSNFVYGSSKAGLTIFLEGLQHLKNNSLVHILCVKPGFVNTKMNIERNTKGLLWAKPEKIAKDILTAVKDKQNMIYTPSYWYIIMKLIRYLPRFIFNKLNI